MLNQNQSANLQIHATAIRLARECVSVVQACLREEEIREATRQFYAVIREGLEAIGTKAK